MYATLARDARPTVNTTECGPQVASSRSVNNSSPPLPWRWWHGVLLAVLTVLGALPPSARLGAHEGFSWDESYYVPAAREYLDGNFTSNFEHPPLAKWAIAAGIELLGDDPSGWRLAAVAAGVVTIP